MANKKKKDTGIIMIVIGAILVLNLPGSLKEAFSHRISAPQAGHTIIGACIGLAIAVFLIVRGSNLYTKHK